MGHHREPIKHTCPDIDKLDEVDALQDLIGDIELILWDYDSELEELRRSNDELRSWGISEAEEEDKLEEKLYK